jgi:uncharacterized protein (UPF0332 family)
VREFDDCLARRALVRFSEARGDVSEAELRVADNDLGEARHNLSEKRWKWATVQGYYSLFHSARGLVTDRGYVEKSHYCLLVAFRELFGQDGEGRDLAEALATARMLRENADYHSVFDEGSARAVVAAAERMLVFARSALGGDG